MTPKQEVKYILQIMQPQTGCVVGVRSIGGYCGACTTLHRDAGIITGTVDINQWNFKPTHDFIIPSRVLDSLNSLIGKSVVIMVR